MFLTPREIDKLQIFTAAQLAQRRKDRGIKLNHPESVALIADHILEGARDGKSVSDLMSSGKNVLKGSQILPVNHKLISYIRNVNTDGEIFINLILGLFTKIIIVIKIII